MVMVVMVVVSSYAGGYGRTDSVSSSRVAGDIVVVMVVLMVLVVVMVVIMVQVVVVVRVVSSEISRNFLQSFRKFSRNLLITYVNQLFPSPALQSDAVK